MSIFSLSVQDSDLAPLFEDLSQNKKLSEIKPLLKAMKKFDWTPHAEEELISIQDPNTFSDKSDRTSSTFKKDEMVTSTENKNEAMEKMRKKWMPLHFEETAPKGGLISESFSLWHKSPPKKVQITTLNIFASCG